MTIIQENHQQGFSLVELMVALLIGLIIMLGATQLFITSKGNFDRVEALAERQETVSFLADMISLDIRTAVDMVEGTDDSGVDYLELRFSDRSSDPYCSGSEKLTALRYQHDGDASIGVRVKCESDADWPSPQPIVGGVASLDAVVDAAGLYADITISVSPLPGESPPQYKFRVASRDAVTSRIVYK